MRPRVFIQMLRLLISVLLLSIPIVPAVLGQLVPDRLPGTWQSEQQKLVITGNGQELRVHGWGKCHPEWCDWGEVPLSLIAPSIKSKAYTHALALWHNDWRTTVAVVRVDQEVLSVEFFKVFHDNSDRSNYRNAALLRRTQ